MEKIGTITISVYRDKQNKTDFQMFTDNESILPVSYVLEDTLKKYQTNFCQSFLYVLCSTYYKNKNCFKLLLNVCKSSGIVPPFLEITSLIFIDFLLRKIFTLF